MRNGMQWMRAAAGVTLALALVVGPAQAARRKASSAPKAAASSPAQTTRAAKAPPSAPVDINNATEQQLVTLPGVGKPTAKKIVAGRPYSSVGDLSRIGMSAAMIRNLSPHLTVGPAPAAARAASAAATTAPATAMPARPARMGGAPRGAATPAPLTPSPATGASATPSPAAGATAQGAAPSPARAPAGNGQVWVNLDTRVYHYPGDRWYGASKHGQYMSEQDAIRAGYRPSKTGPRK